MKISTHRSAFTLVELLVATVITLMLVYGLAQAFAVVSVTVSANRASIEMAGQLRNVSHRLQQDLEGLTVPARPNPERSGGLGYLEYQEGSNHDGSGFGVSNMVGDADDVLMLTSRSVEAPFRGSYVSIGSGVQTAIQSELAEVVWWATWTDNDSNGVLNLDQRDDYTVYRRALLIRPDLNTNTNVAAVGPFMTILSSGAQTSFSTTDNAAGGDMDKLRQAVRAFYSSNDVSVRFFRLSLGGNSIRVYVIANTLADLGQRENRFAHRRLVTGANLYVPPSTFPHPLSRDATSGVGLPTVQPPNTEVGVIKFGAGRGEDVVLSRVLAFDVRAFDPFAPVGVTWGEDMGWGRASFDDNGDGTPDNPANLSIETDEAGWAGSDDEVVIPGDPGFAFIPPTGGVGTPISSAGLNFLRVGSGAFVDLNYASRSYSSNPNSAPNYQYDLLSTVGFADIPAFKSQLGAPSPTPTYDTWSLRYESDGIDQNGDGTVDEGTDGLDNDGANGVDDAGEWETSAPYLLPLRGIRVRIRIIDHDSRQVRQATVTSDFTPE